MSIKRTNLRTKLVRTMIAMLLIVGSATVVVVAGMNYVTSRTTLSTIESHIRNNIHRKGSDLVTSQALALRDLVADNAFSDVARLVERTADQDDEIVYGLFLAEDGRPWGYAWHGSNERGAARPGWKDLGIAAASLKSPGIGVTTRSLLGQAVFEFASPVSDDKGGFLGSLRYAISDRSLRRALADAQAASHKALATTVALLLLLCGGTTALGVLLSRGAASRITYPVRELTSAVEALAAGNRAVRVKINSGDEIEILGASFNRMVEELDTSYRALETLNRVLEQKVEERTVQLERKNRDMQLVMDNVGQGFITLDIEGTMSNERSRVIDDWFGPANGSPKFWDYLHRIDASVAEWFELGWTSLRDDILPLSLSLEQLPALVRKNDRTFELAYHPIMEGARLDKVIVVITSVTARIERERAEQAQREMMSIFRRTLSDRTGLDAFFIETGTLVDAITRSERSDLTLLRRQVHTVKGNAALFGVESVADLCEGLEEKMKESAEAMSANDKDTLRVIWTKIKQMRAQLTDAGPEGGVDEGGVELNRREYDAFIEDLRRRLAHDLLVVTAASWRFEPASKRLALLGEQIRSLTKRLGRAAVAVVCEPTNLRLPPLKWGAFWYAFANVIRNTVDHGVETTEQRVAAGKSPQATVVLSVVREGEHLVVTIADDGPGIDWTKIAARARQADLPHATRADLEQALFVDAISSRDNVTSTSGRGVGLSAVRDIVRELGGVVEIRNDAGRGTAFRFVLPVSMLFDDVSSDEPGPHEVGTPTLRVATN